MTLVLEAREKNYLHAGTETPLRGETCNHTQYHNRPNLDLLEERRDVGTRGHHNDANRMV
jgi:hypothetical protein